MAASAPPPSEGFLETGSIRIVIGIDNDGEEKLFFELETMKPTAAVGYLTVVSDVLRATEVQTWGTYRKPDGPDGRFEEGPPPEGGGWDKDE